MKKITFLFLIFIFGCTSGNHENKSSKLLVQKKMFEYSNNKYIKALSLFNAKLIDHFPKEIDSNYIKYLDATSPDVGEVSLFIEKKINLKEFKNLTNYYSSVSKEILNPSDSLLIVNRFSSENRLYKYKLTSLEKKIIEKSSSYSLPIPNFWRCSFSSDSTACHLSSNFKLYVIEAKKGKYLEDKYLTKGEYMPSDWRNGFSKGIAISEKNMTVIYWIVVW